jgi:polysaccharide biosynthesis protein VpsJ
MTPQPQAVARIEDSLARVVRWVRQHDYKAYEPADGNSSPLFALTGGRVWPMRILQQVVLRSPMNIRPLLGVAPHESAIGRSYMASGYLTMCRHGAPSDIRQEAVSCLAWLMAHRSPGHQEAAWGDPYDYATRSGRRPFGAPILIWTALIGQVFLEAFEVLGEAQYLEVATSAGRWVTSLPMEETTSGVCLSYNAYRQDSIHNSNAMGAAFLARLGATTGDASLISLARRAMEYTCVRQRPDGSWFYAEAPKYHWIDNFHSGYNIAALKTYRDASNDRSFDEHLARGLDYFISHFFETDGRPKYFNDRTYPVDIQCAAQAIETLVSTCAERADALPLALKVANWTIEHMQAADGHFFYRHLGWIRVATPMLHWGQGTMTRALAVLLEALNASTSENMPAHAGSLSAQR